MSGSLYISVSAKYAYMDSMQLELAWAHYDTAQMILSLADSLPYYLFGLNAELFRLSGQLDSAIVALRKKHSLHLNEFRGKRAVEIAELTAVHENEQKEVVLNAQLRENEEQEKLLTRTILLLVVVLALALLLFLSYRRVRSQNKKINQQQGQR